LSMIDRLTVKLIWVSANNILERNPDFSQISHSIKRGT